MKTWKLSYTDKFKHVRDNIIQDMKDINSAMKNRYSNNCVIVVISPCNKHGEISNETTIHIYDNFLDANPLLNQEQYSDDNNISVLQYNLVKDKFLFIFVKSNRNYKRLNKRQVQKMFDDLGFESRVTFLYNEETKIIMH